MTDTIDSTTDGDTAEAAADEAAAADASADEVADAGDAGVDDHGHEAHDEHHGPTDAFFVKVFVFLAVVTGLEVAASYIELGPAFLPILLGLMVIKFFSVVLIFMHVRYDAKIFGNLFYVGLVLAVGVYIVMLLSFQFFAS